MSAAGESFDPSTDRGAGAMIPAVGELPPPGTPGPLPPPVPQPPQPVHSTAPLPHFWIIVGGAAAAILGAFLPWASVSAAFVGSISREGIEGDGRITAGLSVLAGVFAITMLRAARRPATGYLIFVGAIGGAILAAGVYDYRNLQDVFDNMTEEQKRLIVAKVGTGLYLTMVGGLTIVVGAVLGSQARRSSTSAPSE
jgi:hypothetical protein